MTETVARIKSAYLKNERPIWIMRTRSAARPRRIAIFLDGELYRERVKAGPVIGRLLADRRIANAWFVFVSMESPESRWKECPCHRPFAHFVVKELLPWLESRHPEIRAVRERVLSGLSYTGLAAAFIALEYPGIFQKVICQSGSFWWNDCRLVKRYEKLRQPVPTEFFLDVGTRETEENVRHRETVFQGVSQIAGVRGFRDTLLRKGCHATYVEFEGGHEFAGWRKTLPKALRWALPRSNKSKLFP
jgi:enterochelin esterase-like enzyme